MSATVPNPKASAASPPLMPSERLKVLLASGMDRFTIDAAFVRALLAEREAVVNARADDFVAEARAEAQGLLDAAKQAGDIAASIAADFERRRRRRAAICLWVVALASLVALRLWMGGGL